MNMITAAKLAATTKKANVTPPELPETYFDDDWHLVVKIKNGPLNVPSDKALYAIRVVIKPHKEGSRVTVYIDASVLNNMAFLVGKDRFLVGFFKKDISIIKLKKTKSPVGYTISAAGKNFYKFTFQDNNKRPAASSLSYVRYERHGDELTIYTDKPI